MITVDTMNPVYSNLKGKKTAEQKQETRGKLWEKTKNVYGKAKESGLLQGLENLALKQGGSGAVSYDPSAVTDKTLIKDEKPKEPMSTGMKIGIGVGVLAVGFAIYWFAIRKK